MDCIKPLSQIVRKPQSGRSDYSESGEGIEPAYLVHSIQSILHKRLLGTVEILSLFRCLSAGKKQGRDALPSLIFFRQASRPHFVSEARPYGQRVHSWSSDQKVFLFPQPCRLSAQLSYQHSLQYAFCVQ